MIPLNDNEEKEKKTPTMICLEVRCYGKQCIFWAYCDCDMGKKRDWAHKHGVVKND